MKETPREVRWLLVHTSQHMRKSTRNAATRKCLTVPFLLETMILFCSTARAADVGPTQPLPDDWAHSEASPQGIACGSRHPRSAPDCNQQTPLRSCTSCASPSKQLLPLSARSQSAINTATSIKSAAGSINALEQADRSDMSRQKKSRRNPTAEWNLC